METASLPIVALIDDDDIFQIITSRSLKSLKKIGEVLQFLGGREALLYLKENASERDKLPDIIFLDINMPVVDGWMFLKEFENLKPTLSKASIKIYMISSSIDYKDMERARNIPDVYEYIVKPVSMTKFTEVFS